MASRSSLFALPTKCLFRDWVCVGAGNLHPMVAAGVVALASADSEQGTTQNALTEGRDGTEITARQRSWHRQGPSYRLFSVGSRRGTVTCLYTEWFNRESSPICLGICSFPHNFNAGKC